MRVIEYIRHRPGDTDPDFDARERYRLEHGWRLEAVYYDPDTQDDPGERRFYWALLGRISGAPVDIVLVPSRAMLSDEPSAVAKAIRSIEFEGCRVLIWSELTELARA